MPWELRVRGLNCDGSRDEVRALKREAQEFIRRIQTLGHRMEVVFETPDGGLDVYEVRPLAKEAPESS